MYEGPSWLGPSLKEILTGIGEDLARERPSASVHTIWELTLHIAAWLRISRERLSATQIRDANAGEDWQSMGNSWQDTIFSLDSEVHALGEAILKFPVDCLLEKAPASEDQTFYVLLHGVIQHCAYHAGQVALLRKML